MSPAEVTAIWTNHKSKPTDVSYFTETATLTYIPTSAGGQGRDSIRHFLELVHSDTIDSSTDHGEFQLVHQTVGTNSIVEETVASLTITKGNSVWICPGADIRLVIGKKVVIPLVTSATFNSGKIESKRVYWDQASVLAQIGLISPAMIKNNEMPVLVGEEEANILRKPKETAYNRLSNVDIGTELSQLSIKHPHDTPEKPSGNILAQGAEPIAYRLSSRVLQPGGTGGKSSIFSNEPEERRAIPADPRRYQTQISFGADGNTAPDTKPHPASAAAQQMQSNHFEIGHSEQPPPPATPGKKQHPNKTNTSQINMAPPSDEQQETTVGKKQHPDKTNVSHFSIAPSSDDQQGEDSNSISGARKRPVSANQNYVSSIGFGSETSNVAPNVRPSSRVIKPPGGGSTLTFG